MLNQSKPDKCRAVFANFSFFQHIAEGSGISKQLTILHFGLMILMRPPYLFAEI